MYSLRTIWMSPRFFLSFLKVPKLTTNFKGSLKDFDASAEDSGVEKKGHGGTNPLATNLLLHHWLKTHNSRGFCILCPTELKFSCEKIFLKFTFEFHPAPIP